MESGWGPVIPELLLRSSPECYIRAGLDQESRPIFPSQTLKSGSLIGRRIEANPDEFRLGVKAITKY
jgi:hypothetical protein